MTTQPETAKYCSDVHRVYAWRGRQKVENAAGIALEDKFVTARVVTG
jgi:hypothetical protein